MSGYQDQIVLVQHLGRARYQDQTVLVQHLGRARYRVTASGHRVTAGVFLMHGHLRPLYELSVYEVSATRVLGCLTLLALL